MHTTAKTRQSNFELVRIIAMLMIVASHLACHGVQHILAAENAYSDYNAASLFNRLFTSFFESGRSNRSRSFFYADRLFCLQERLLLSQESCASKRVLFICAWRFFYCAYCN